MNLRQIELFVAVAEAQNVTRAAKQLFVSQSALSHQLALLETELGCPLLIRGSRGVQLTPAGEKLYTHGRAVLEDVLRTVEIVHETSCGIHGRIILGTLYSCIPHISAVLDGFTRQYPDISFELLPDIPERLVEHLEKDQIQLMVLRSPMAEIRNYPYALLKSDPTVVAIPSCLDPVPEQETISLQHLKGIPFCASIERNRAYRNWDYGAALRDECRARGFDLLAPYECSGTMGCILMACSGICACYAPESLLRMLDCRGLHIKRLADFNSATQSILIWDDRRYLSRPLQLFLDWCKNAGMA